MSENNTNKQFAIEEERSFKISKRDFLHQVNILFTIVNTFKIEQVWLQDHRFDSAGGAKYNAESKDFSVNIRSRIRKIEHKITLPIQYSHATKYQISETKAFEFEQDITSEEYGALYAIALKNGKQVTKKIRHSLLFLEGKASGYLITADVYPDKDFVVIECEKMDDAEEKLVLPQEFLDIVTPKE